MTWRPFKRMSGGDGSHLHRIEAKWSLYKTWIRFISAGSACQHSGIQWSPM